MSSDTNTHETAAAITAALGGSDSALHLHQDVSDADAGLPRRRAHRRSSMTGRVTGMRRRGSMASQISQTSASTPDTGAAPQTRRTRRRNSMLSNASHDSARSRASHNIDVLAAEIRDLQECREHELALAEEEKRRLRLERQQSAQSAEMLEDLIETASMADGSFDVEAALLWHEHEHEQIQQRNRDGNPPIGVFSVPDAVVVEEPLKGGEDSGEISTGTLGSVDPLVSYEQPVKGDLDDYKKPYKSSRRGRRRSSLSDDDEESVCSVDKLDYAENKIERIQQARRSRSMSVDRGAGGTTAAKRKPRRGRRQTRSSSRDPGGDSGASAGGGRQIRSRSLDVARYRPRHQRKRAVNFKSMRRLEAAAIEDLKDKIKERKAEIAQIRERMEMRVESAEENATMMDEIASMQIKTLSDLKVEILKTKANLCFNAARRQDADAIAAELKSDPDYQQALQQLEESRHHLVELRRRNEEIVQEENETNARQAELLRQIPQIRAEGVVQNMKWTLEYNRIMESKAKEDLASRSASMRIRIAKCNSNQAAKDMTGGKYGNIKVSEDHQILKTAFASARNEMQQIRDALSVDAEKIGGLPELRSKPTQVARAFEDNSLLVEDATAAIERASAEWREQYIYLRISRGRDEEIANQEEQISRLNEDITRLRRLRSQKRKEAEAVERKDKHAVGSKNAKSASVGKTILTR